jgi:O-antigen ligase
MQQPQVIEKWWFQWGSFAFLFITTILFAYTGKYLLLLAPVVFFFMVLMWLNWKTAYWLLLFCIPISMAIELIPGSLSTAIPDEPMMWTFTLLFAILWAHNPRILPEWWWRNPIVMIIVLQFAWTLVAVAFSKELFLSVKYTIAKAWMVIACIPSIDIQG